MTATRYRATRWLFETVLRFVPTCDLQRTLEGRLGVVAYDVPPHRSGALTLGNAPAIPLRGPCTVTVNAD